MKNDLKTALDASLSGMDWHGETAVLTTLRSQKKKSVLPPMRVLILATLILIALLSTALALGLRYSARSDVQRRAAQALKETYGLTEEMLDLFAADTQRTQQGWTVIYRSLMSDAAELGTYTVEITGTEAAASWSHDGVDPSLIASGLLSAPAWGSSQLARIVELYRERAENWRSAAELEALTLEERAALDAPLLEVAQVGSLIHIVPQEGDVTIAEAQRLAREAVTAKYGVPADQLAKFEVTVDFYLYGGTAQREYQIMLDSPQRTESYRVFIASPSGSATYCRWYVQENERTLPAGELRPYAEAAREYVESGAFDLLNAEEKAQTAARYREAGLEELLPQVYAAARQGDLSETDAITLAEAALQERYGLAAGGSHFFRRSTARIEAQGTRCWQIVYQPAEQGNWHWRDFEKLGVYTVLLQAENGAVLECTWSLEGAETQAFTEATFGAASAYDASMLPWIEALLQRLQTILDRYPPDVNLNEMTLEDRAAYDATMRAAGYGERSYPNVLPQAGDLSQEEAAALALQAIGEVYSPTIALQRGAAFHEGFRLYFTEEGAVRAWYIAYENGDELYEAAVNAENGEIEQLWHDSAALGNG